VLAGFQDGCVAEAGHDAHLVKRRREWQSRAVGKEDGTLWSVDVEAR
jgi:hypothetical protein